MQELLFGIGFIAVLIIGVVLIRKQGFKSLGTTKTVSKLEVDEIMRKPPEERTLAEAITLKIFEEELNKKKL